jgi:hypothetical protein
MNQVKTVPADIFDKVMPERLKKQRNLVRKVNAVVLFKLSGPNAPPASARHRPAPRRS